MSTPFYKINTRVRWYAIGLNSRDLFWINFNIFDFFWQIYWGVGWWLCKLDNLLALSRYSCRFCVLRLVQNKLLSNDETCYCKPDKKWILLFLFLVVLVAGIAVGTIFFTNSISKYLCIALFRFRSFSAGILILQ